MGHCAANAMRIAAGAMRAARMIGCVGRTSHDGTAL